MGKLSSREIKSVLKDVINGYSRTRHRSFGDIYVKHYTSYDNALIDDYKDLFYRNAREKGLQSNQEKMDDLIREGDWSEDKNRQIIELKRSIGNLHDTRAKLFIEHQKKSIQEKIEASSESLQKLESEKSSLLGYTAEVFSSKKANEYFIFESLRKDREMKERFFDEESFDDLDNFSLGELIHLYNEISENFSELNLKRTAYSSGFLNLFYMSPESVYEFYGKPVLELTFYQIEVYSNAKIFKNLVSNSKYPPSTEAYHDPDLLVSWVNDAKDSGDANKNSTSSDSAGGNKESVGGGASYVGASKDDLKKIAKDGDNIISLSAEARKMGGNLNMQDIMKLHGIKV